MGEIRFEGINPYYHPEKPSRKVKRTEKPNRTRRPKDEYDEYESKKSTKKDSIQISKEAIDKSKGKKKSEK